MKGEKTVKNIIETFFSLIWQSSLFSDFKAQITLVQSKYLVFLNYIHIPD